MGFSCRKGSVVMYSPRQGDIVFLDFSPQSGHELSPSINIAPKGAVGKWQDLHNIYCESLKIRQCIVCKSYFPTAPFLGVNFTVSSQPEINF